jgi:UDP-glucose:(heptosyl)LPS alpha-1,3-glucosyltransferase
VKLLYIVRRYGPVGGMERYVWELSLRVRDLGLPVTVICQRCHAEIPQGITVIELGEVPQRPGWIAALRFSRRVSKWLEKNPQINTVIHSHERVRIHHVTTFHGPPFANVCDKPWWKRFSIRVFAQLFLERRELSTAIAIVPNSEMIKEQLRHYYPEYAHKLTLPVVPGVEPGKQRDARVVPMDGGVVGFVGKEWKRKGLPFAAEIVKELRLTRPNCRLVVIGPGAQSNVQELFADWSGGYELAGWSKFARYTEFDVLLHPAVAEPYGMVITEAMSARVPVVISDACGARTEVTVDAGEVLSLDLTTKQWAGAVNRQLTRATPAPGFTRDWSVVAQESVSIYSKITSKT